MKSRLARALPFVLVLVAIPLAFLLFSGLLGERTGQEALRLTEESIRRAAVQCYALEGAYPTSMDALEERYGVSVDERRYWVDYVYIASNLMPDITVIPLD